MNLESFGHAILALLGAGYLAACFYLAHYSFWGAFALVFFCLPIFHAVVIPVAILLGLAAGLFGKKNAE